MYTMLGTDRTRVDRIRFISRTAEKPLRSRSRRTVMMSIARVGQ